MTNPAATSSLVSTGSNIQKSFGGNSTLTPMENATYQNPAGWIMAPFFGLMEAKNRSSLGSNPTTPPPPGQAGAMAVNAGGSGAQYKTLLGQ